MDALDRDIDHHNSPLQILKHSRKVDMRCLIRLSSLNLSYISFQALITQVWGINNGRTGVCFVYNNLFKTTYSKYVINIGGKETGVTRYDMMMVVCIGIYLYKWWTNMYQNPDKAKANYLKAFFAVESL